MPDGIRARADGTSHPAGSRRGGPWPDPGGRSRRLARAAAAADRRAGARLRALVTRRPAAEALAGAASTTVAPAFRIALVAGLARARTRPAAAEAALAAEIAARIAALARPRLGRRRPGERPDAGFPSRHAAASAAIAASAWRHDRRVGAGAALAAGAGGIARVAAAEHEPADILAGAALGVVVAAVVHHGAQAVAWSRWMRGRSAQPGARTRRSPASG